MKVAEFAARDGLALAELVESKEVTPKELALAALGAMEAIDGDLKAVVECYDDRIGDLDEESLGSGPFRGVPFLIKDVGGQEKGRKIEFGSRLCEGMVAEFDTNYIKVVREAGLNVIGRSNAPEFSIAGSAENLLYGNTSTPWKIGHSAGGSTGGGAAAVAAGIVPIAHGSDIAGSIRIPAAWCGGVGLKPSRGMVSAGPVLDESGYGLAMNFVQTKSLRDTAALLDCLGKPQPGDPFVIARPPEPFSAYLSKPLAPLRIAFSSASLMDLEADPEISAATEKTAKLLESMGHSVEEAALPFDHWAASEAMTYYWFYGFDKRLDEYARKTGRKVGPDTVEAVVWEIYKLSQTIEPARFLESMAWLNGARRKLGRFFENCDVFVSPAAMIVSPPHGPYGLNEPGWNPVDYIRHGDRPVQYSFPFNAAGAPAIALPLAQHSNGLPIGIQLAARPSEDHLLIALGAALEEALPWADRLPPLHASKV